MARFIDKLSKGLLSATHRATQLESALRAVLPYALSRIEDLTEISESDPLTVKAAEAYEQAAALLHPAALFPVAGEEDSDPDDYRTALIDLVIRCDGSEGVRADGSNIDTCAAHTLIDRPYAFEIPETPENGF